METPLLFTLCNVITWTSSHMKGDKQDAFMHDVVINQIKHNVDQSKFKITTFYNRSPNNYHIFIEYGYAIFICSILNKC